MIILGQLVYNMCCILIISSYDHAIMDAEIALSFMPGSFRALLAMGEALYNLLNYLLREQNEIKISANLLQ